MKVKKRSPKLTRLEKLTKGLSSDSKKYKSRFSVCEVEGKGRSLFLLKGTVKKDSFVLEYEGELISHEEAEMRERTYELNKEGCYILFFRFQERRWAIDATRRFKSYARYLNHSRQPNIRFHAPIVVDLNGQNVPRIAAYALRDIHEGEEIVFDYGIRDTDLSWLKNTKRSHMSELPSDSSESEGELEDDSSSDGIEMSLRKPGITPCSTQRQTTISLTASPYLNHPPATQSSETLPAVHAMRFYPRFSQSGVRPSYIVKFEDLQKPEKIHRIIEEDKPHCSRPSSVISLSGSDSYVKSLSSSLCHESEPVMLESENELPKNTELSSMSKVMEWQCQNSSTSDMQSDIKILNVKSLGASPSYVCSNNSPLPFEVDRPFISQTSGGSMVSQQYNPSSTIVPSMSNTPSNSHPVFLHEARSSSFRSPTPSTSYKFNEGHKSHGDTYEHSTDRMFISDLLRTRKRLREKGNHIEDLEIPESPTTPKPKSSHESLSDDEDFTIFSDAEPAKTIFKTKFKGCNEDRIQIISSDSDSDVEITIVDNQPKQDINQSAERILVQQPCLQRSGRQECFQKILNNPAESLVSPPLQNLKQEDHSKFSYASPSSAEYPVPPSTAAATPEIIIDDEPTGAGKDYAVHISSRPDEMDHTSKLNLGDSNSGSVPLSSSNTTSHQGPSLLRQSLSSPPVAVIKPFYAHDELDINQEEKCKLREILGPHLFNDNTTSQAVIQTAICKNWSFFKALTDRGITIDGIRASVRRFVKAAEKERRQNMNEKA